MAHFPKPFFRSARNAWFVQIGDRQVKLSADKDEAFTRYHEMMAKPSLPPVTQAEAGKLVVVIVDEFLDWCEKHRAPDTYRWYKDRLNSFIATIDPALTVDQLKPHHVQKWVDNYGVPLKSGSRRNLIASVKRSMRWAEEQGYPPAGDSYSKSMEIIMTAMKNDNPNQIKHSFSLGQLVITSNA